MPKICGTPSNYWRTIRIGELLNVYDRILHLDTDMIVNKNVPNIFDLVPEDKIGGVREDVGSRKGDRIARMADIQNEYGSIDWQEGYINEGFFLVSSMHKEIFMPHRGTELYATWAYTQSHMNYKIKEFNFEIFDVGYKWNHMGMFSEPWNGNPNRFESHIIHYAGRGVFEPGPTNKLEQAHLDYKRIYK